MIVLPSRALTEASALTRSMDSDATAPPDTMTPTVSPTGTSVPVVHATTEARAMMMLTGSYASAGLDTLDIAVTLKLTSVSPILANMAVPAVILSTSTIVLVLPASAVGIVKPILMIVLAVLATTAVLVSIWWTPTNAFATCHTLVAIAKSGWTLALPTNAGTVLSATPLPTTLISSVSANWATQDDSVTRT